jgi:hypothetical protein
VHLDSLSNRAIGRLAPRRAEARRLLLSPLDTGAARSPYRVKGAAGAAAVEVAASPLRQPSRAPTSDNSSRRKAATGPAPNRWPGLVLPGSAATLPRARSLTTPLMRQTSAAGRSLSHERTRQRTSARTIAWRDKRASRRRGSSLLVSRNTGRLGEGCVAATRFRFKFWESRSSSGDLIALSATQGKSERPSSSSDATLAIASTDTTRPDQRHCSSRRFRPRECWSRSRAELIGGAPGAAAPGPKRAGACALAGARGSPNDHRASEMRYLRCSTRQNHGGAPDWSGPLQHARSCYAWLRGRPCARLRHALGSAA